MSFAIGGHLIQIPLEIILDSRLVKQLTDMAASAHIDVMKELEVILSNSVDGPITVKAARDACCLRRWRIRGWSSDLSRSTYRLS